MSYSHIYNKVAGYRQNALKQHKKHSIFPKKPWIVHKLFTNVIQFV